MAASGRSPRFESSLISTSNKRRIVIRGRDLVDDVMGNITFAQMICLLSTGRWLNPEELELFDAILVALVPVGLTRPAVISRATYTAAPDQIQGAIAAGLLGADDAVLRELEQVGSLLEELDRRLEAGATLGQAARILLEGFDEASGEFPGFSDVLEAAEQRRVDRIMLLAFRSGKGRHLASLAEVGAAVEERSGRGVVARLNSVVAAVLVGLEIPSNSFRGFAVIGEATSLVAHVGEERDFPLTRSIQAELKTLNGVKEFDEPAS